MYLHAIVPFCVSNYNKLLWCFWTVPLIELWSTKLQSSSNRRFPSIFQSFWGWTGHVKSFRLISRAGNERVCHLNKGKTSSFNYSGIFEGHWYNDSILMEDLWSTILQIWIFERNDDCRIKYVYSGT